MSWFTGYRESFSAETLAVLEAAFNAAWDAVVASGVDCDPQATRTALAEAIVYFASEGERSAAAQRSSSGCPSEGALRIKGRGLSTHKRDRWCCDWRLIPSD